MGDREDIRDRLDRLDYRVTYWLTHTNAGVITGVVVAFAVLAIVAALLG